MDRLTVTVRVGGQQHDDAYSHPNQPHPRVTNADLEKKDLEKKNCVAYSTEDGNLTGPGRATRLRCLALAAALKHYCTVQMSSSARAV
jgi:hypothetical protein